MQHINTVFSQLLTKIPRYEFNKVVKRYNGDKREGSMSCWTQFSAMLIACQSASNLTPRQRRKVTLQQLAILVTVNIMERRNIDELMMRKKPPKAKEENLNQMKIIWA